MSEILNTILRGDTKIKLREIPDNFVDIGVTSPPYNKGEKQKGWLVKNVEYDNAADKRDESAYQAEQIEVLNELWRVTKEGGSFFYNHKTRWERGKMIHPMEWLLKTKWEIKQEIVWDRAIAANLRGWRFWQVEERIYWLHKPKNGNLIGEELISKHALMTSIWRFAPEQKSAHPAPFPLQLPLRAIYSILDDNKDCVVIDPYSGSGTTLLAAKLLGHNYIGVEISDTYIKMAEERLANYQSETAVFKDEIAKHTVRETFKERKDRGVYHHHDKKKRSELAEASLRGLFGS
ncbi:MAG: site-specific DNA-methyltransferase [Helicobacteraceae bacterium]|jgi:modification methylase|nr:site-specific DNA-methyltransferase [Helicobacteraceae bacterium]